jgi:hypothetical protein
MIPGSPAMRLGRNADLVLNFIPSQDIALSEMLGACARRARCLASRGSPRVLRRTRDKLLFRPCPYGDTGIRSACGALFRLSMDTAITPKAGVIVHSAGLIETGTPVV